MVYKYCDEVGLMVTDIESYAQTIAESGVTLTLIKLSSTIMLSIMMLFPACEIPSMAIFTPLTPARLFRHTSTCFHPGKIKFGLGLTTEAAAGNIQENVPPKPPTVALMVIESLLFGKLE